MPSGKIPADGAPIKRTGNMKNICAFLLLIAAGAAIVHADKIISDVALGYSIYLPSDTWIRKIKDSTHHQFYDSTFGFKSILSIKRYAYNHTTYATPEEWTRANFIAYKLCVEYSFSPFGAMVYYDTASTVRQGTLWATESYATFITVDTAYSPWSEYTRFTANKTYGYELYALGDTADMMKNIGAYAALLKLVQLPQDTITAVRPITIAPVSRPSSRNIPPVLFDPLGRKLAAPGKSAPVAGVYILPREGHTGVMVKLP
jgi:hypothetical protein